MLSCNSAVISVRRAVKDEAISFARKEPSCTCIRAFSSSTMELTTDFDVSGLDPSDESLEWREACVSETPRFGAELALKEGSGKGRGEVISWVSTEVGCVEPRPSFFGRRGAPCDI